MSDQRSDAIVFFGASGDLAYKQIFPSLMRLVRDEGVTVPIVGVAKSGWSLEQLKNRAKDSLEHHGGADPEAFQGLANLLHYVDGDYNDPATFTQLRQELGDAQRPLHYLAIPPSLFAVVTEGLAKSGCATNARLVVEKPFGHNRATARELSRVLHQYFPEENIFRIDHYLGKEPVQNLLYTRFANPIFEPIWNRTHVRSIQITMAEEFGVQDRGKFYDETGAIRDVVQNHMLQVLANLTMDPPTGEDREAIRDQKVDLLKAVQPLKPDQVVRGQYAGYHQVPGVKPGSTVETFVALQLTIDTWRWADVPIYIRAGKELPVTASEVSVEFKRPPFEIFGENVPCSSSHLRMRISPDITIGLGVRVKSPGERMVGNDVELILSEHPEGDMPPYQRLLGDAFKASGELFAREDFVDAQWRVVEPILDDVTPLYKYECRTWGPEEVERLIGSDGPWINPKVSTKSKTKSKS
jgi:glucose-6-phosphate 1-dehydrogenase